MSFDYKSLMYKIHSDNTFPMIIEDKITKLPIKMIRAV